jgi:hypothetical protein
VTRSYTPVGGSERDTVRSSGGESAAAKRRTLTPPRGVSQDFLLLQQRPPIRFVGLALAHFLIV